MLLLPCLLGLSVFFYGLWAMKHDVPTSVSSFYVSISINSDLCISVKIFVRI